MTLTAKVAVPYPAFGFAHRSIIERVEKYQITLIAAPSGCLLTDSLAAGLYDKNWPVTWCRLSVEDRDPGMLLKTMIQVLQQLAPQVGSETIRRMRHQPGPVSGWSQLFAALAAEAASSIPLPCWIVLENVHHFNHNSAALEMLVFHFLSLLPASAHAILITPALDVSPSISTRVPLLGERDLRLDLYSGQQFALELVPDLGANDLIHLVELLKGWAGNLAGVLSAARLMDATRFMNLLKQTHSSSGLMSQIARTILLTQNSTSIEALAVCQQVEYCHEHMVKAILLGNGPPDGPWWQPLENGWQYLRPYWSAPLRVALRSAASGHIALARAANFYLQHKAPEKSVPLFLEIGELSRAAEVMDSVVDQMMDLGQWELLRSWINRLPAPILHQWPWLVYAGSEMIASQGDLSTSRRAFGKTTSLFRQRQEVPGICQSLLAECALAIQDNDWEAARASAEDALYWAEQGALSWYLVWANWTLGCLHLKFDQFEQAQPCYLKAHLAAASLVNPDVSSLTEMMVNLMENRHDIAQVSEHHRLAYLELENKQQAVINQIQYLVQDAPGHISGLLESCGWSNIPLTLKLPVETPHPQPALPPSAPAVGLKELLQGLVGMIFRPLRATGRVQMLPVTEAAEPASLEEIAPAQLTPPKPQICYPNTSLVITVYLLGPFRVVAYDQPIPHWPKGRGRSLFEYLLMHRNRPTPREVLMDIFWTETPPEIARNRLNVALHGIRKILSDADDRQLILFQDGAYQLNPLVDYWVDVDEFTCQYQEACRLDEEQAVQNAIATYEACISLYTGDYLEDEPYEEWPVLIREKLRINYLSVLDRLSEIYLIQGQYTRCIDLCQRILERDNCREDAYGRLMRCYAGQDQIPLALRQYQVCVEMLKKELNVEPSLATRRLYERILRRDTFEQDSQT
jgi:DNA-binding SARP family transcriptional activator